MSVISQLTVFEVSAAPVRKMMESRGPDSLHNNFRSVFNEPVNVGRRLVYKRDYKGTLCGTNEESERSFGAWLSL